MHRFSCTVVKSGQNTRHLKNNDNYERDECNKSTKVDYIPTTQHLLKFFPIQKEFYVVVFAIVLFT